MDYMRKLQQPQNTKHWRLLKQLGDHMTCQYNHFLINSKNDCTKRSHIILKCLKNILAYRLPKSANLSNEHEQLIKAT